MLVRCRLAGIDGYLCGPGHCLTKDLDLHSRQRPASRHSDVPHAYLEIAQAGVQRYRHDDGQMERIKSPLMAGDD